LRLVGLKLAAANERRAAGDLQRVATFVVAVPLHEGAVAESDRALARDLRDLVARPPEGAIHKPHAARISLLHPHHGRVRAMKGDEFPIGNINEFCKQKGKDITREIISRAIQQKKDLREAGILLGVIQSEDPSKSEKEYDNFRQWVTRLGLTKGNK
jgi:hypothetical protein